MPNKNEKQLIDTLERKIRRIWSLGKYALLAWTRTNNGINILSVASTDLSSCFFDNFSRKQKSVIRALGSFDDRESYLRNLISTSRELEQPVFEKALAVFNVQAKRIKLMLPSKNTDGMRRMIDNLFRRYSISYVEDRAAILIDIVGFSLYSQVERVLVLNCLAYSISAAHEQLLGKKINFEFARSSTGDGFYIWNRDSSIEANISLYHLMHLILAYNSIDRKYTRSKCIPVLKTAFQVGSCYEFYQCEDLKPTKYNYLVGDLTIELARLLEKAMPGQILMGDFQANIERNKAGNITSRLNTIDFINRLQDSLNVLTDMYVGDYKINSIKCYLTGEPLGRSKYSISKY